MVRTTTAPDNLAEVIERRIRSGTFGQVRDLRVECSGCSVVLHGRVETYYVKQLAQHAALDVLTNGSDLVNEIAVAARPSLRAALSQP